MYLSAFYSDPVTRKAFPIKFCLNLDLLQQLNIGTSKFEYEIGKFLFNTKY